MKHAETSYGRELLLNVGWRESGENNGVIRSLDN